jgi:hypothetical protein
LPIQRDPTLRERGLISGKLRVVAGKADLTTDALFEGVFLLRAPFSAEGLRPVVQRRSVVAAKADRDEIVVLEKSSPIKGYPVLARVPALSPHTR